MRGIGLTNHKVLVAIAACTMGLVVIGSARAAVKPTTAGQETLAEDSFRLSFNLKTPRRFATRYLKSKRTLEVRVSPARSAEFDTSSYYDPRFVHRVMVREEMGEVVLAIQLKNLAVGWLVTHQEEPWRLVLDFWRTEVAKAGLEEEWNWQDDNASHDASEERMPAKSSPAPYVSPAPGSDEEESESTEDKSEGAETEDDELPPNMGRLEPLAPLTPAKLAKLREAVGQAMGTPHELARTTELAVALHRSGKSREALTVFRRLASLSEKEFRSDPEMLWLAGESAYLTRKWDLANDYFTALSGAYPKSVLASQARLRIEDMRWLSLSGANRKSGGESVQKAYTEIALSEKSSERAKIAAALRLTSENIDSNPSTAKMYQQNLDTCVNKALVPFEMRKNCFYISIRGRIDSLEIRDVDAAVVAFAKFSEGDPRVGKLEGMLMQRVETFLKESQKTKAWQAWLDFEKQARPRLLDSTRKDADLLVARAQAWESAGDARAAAKLYSLAWSSDKSGPRRDEAAAAAARVLRKGGRVVDSERHLKDLENSDYRKRNGLSPQATAIVRDLALPPYRNSRAIRILSEEIKTGRHNENDLHVLVGLAEAQRSTAHGEALFAKVRAYPVARPEDAQLVEKALMGYAQDLARRGRHAQAADMFFAVANISQGKRRAEAAYQAGNSYSRAGMLEKARTSWQLAAGEVSDRKYSTLASERLDRIR